jgi:glycosyltransferase involved in cell wall biosynthesis
MESAASRPGVGFPQTLVEEQSVSSHVPFSLLLPVHASDRAEYVRLAFHSAVQDQTVPPDHVVMVQDGPVPEPLAEVISELRSTSPVPVTFVPLEHNLGLGPALDAGLAASPHDVIARMDSDDVAMPRRFEVQLPLIAAGADIVGAGLLEFGEDTDDIVGRRTPPSDPADIRRYARIHDPFNHPTVIYRRTAVLAAGGYGDLPLMEDYWLFARMLANGAKPANVPEPLVYYRVGAGAYQRRGGKVLLRSELALQRRLRDEGFISSAQYVRNVVIRGGYRLLPWWVRRAAYRLVVAPYGRRRGRARAASAAAGMKPAHSPVAPHVDAEPPARPQR